MNTLRAILKGIHGKIPGVSNAKVPTRLLSKIEESRDKIDSTYIQCMGLDQDGRIPGQYEQRCNYHR